MIRAGIGPALLLLAASCGGGGESADTTIPATSSTTSSTTTTAAPTTSTSVTEPTIEEVSFPSGAFELVGDLALPGGEGFYPAVIVVSGSGPQTRLSTPGYETIKRKFSDAGFAVLSWDKPGSGDSTGEFAEGLTLNQRAAILADGVAYLAARPDIDAARIGVWGLSQGGWVMPFALDLTDDIAFMIVVSGGGENGIEQMGYLIGQQLVCEGRTAEEGALAEQYFPQYATGTTYAEYTEAMEVLLAIPGMGRFVGSEILPEDQWQPWPSHIDAYFDPMTIIERTTIPVLAIFGEMDRNVDPVQGSAAYEQALATAGNGTYHVEMIPGIGHTMLEQTTGCIGEAGGATSERYLELLDEWVALLAATI